MAHVQPTLELNDDSAVATVTGLEHPEEFLVDKALLDNLRTASLDSADDSEFLSRATMTVHNDKLSTLTVNISDSEHMGENFPNEDITAGASDFHQVKVSSWYPGQCWFKTTFDGTHEIKTDLGAGLTDTDANPLWFNDGQVAAMLSPIVVTPVAVKYDLDYFVGPGTIPPLVNGFIQSNLPAILAHINKFGIVKKWDSGLSVSLSQFAMNPIDLMCSYVGVSNATSTSADLNVIMRLNNKTSVTGSFLIKDHAVTSLTGDFKDLAIMLQLHVSSDPLNVEIKSLKCSLGDYNLPTTFWVLVGLLFPWALIWLSTAAISAAALAMIINTVLNDTIVSKLNGVLKSALPKSAPTTFSTSANYNHPETTGIDEPETATDDNATWMTSSSIQSKLLRDVHMPGAHDSGAYALSSFLPNVPYSGGEGIKYDDIKFLWALTPGAAPSNGDWPFSTDKGAWPTEDKPAYIGQAMYDFMIKSVVKGTSQAGDQDIFQQLQAGIRWFDLRIYLDNDGRFYMQHGLRGPSLVDILTQVKTFLDTYPQSKELVFLNLSHADYTSKKTGLVCDAINKIIPASSIYYPGSETIFDFQSLATRKVGDIVGSATKIMFLNADGNGLTYGSPVTNTAGFEETSAQPLSRMTWCTTPGVADIIPYVLGQLQGQDRKLLQSLATQKNGTLAERLTDPQARKTSVIILDWSEYSTGALPIPQVIALNNN